MLECKQEKHAVYRQVEYSQKRHQPIISYMRRSPIKWVVLVLVLVVSTFMQTTTWAAQPESSVPADTFMQSVVKRDGNLGWHQLCSDLQSQLPLSMLVSQVQQQRVAESKEGLSLTVDYLGSQAQPQGGQIRAYVVTAHLPNGWVGQRTYIIYTQASGCVEDVKNI